jgi:hypothetical protein
MGAVSGLQVVTKRERRGLNDSKYKLSQIGNGQPSMLFSECSAVKGRPRL